MPTLRTTTKLKLGYLGIAALDTWLSGKAHPMAHRARFLTKPLLMPTLAASLATNPKAADSPLRTSTLVGPGGGWGGDVALLGVGHQAVPGRARARSRSGTRRTSPGSSAARNHEPLTEPLEVRVIAGSWLVSAPALALLARRQQPRARRPGVRLRDDPRGDGDRRAPPRRGGAAVSARRLTMAGASLFMVSDTLLGIRMFALKDPPAGSSGP